MAISQAETYVVAPGSGLAWYNIVCVHGVFVDAIALMHAHACMLSKWCSLRETIINHHHHHHLAGKPMGAQP